MTREPLWATCILKCYVIASKVWISCSAFDLLMNVIIILCAGIKIKAFTNESYLFINVCFSEL